jgi:CRP-like cAMP-binding protein
MGPENHFLTSLSQADRRALDPGLSLIELERGQVLAEPGLMVTYVWLPQGSVISIVTLMRDGRAVESRTIGLESGFGLLNALGSRLSYERVTVQIPGPTWRISADALGAAARQSPSLVKSIVVHGQATLVQAAQQTACNALHGVDSRLCRWLLLTQDRVQADILPLTQEHLAIMLGVQRTTVTAAASQLQDRGSITYTRGKIRILDRPAVEACACECYEAIRRGAALMLGDPEAR